MNRCGECGRFFSWDTCDSYVPWGCANPEYPEPYDPVFICAACSDRTYQRMLARFLEEGLPPGPSDWIASSAERKARRVVRSIWRARGGRPEPQHLRVRQAWLSGQQHEIACACGWVSRHGREACEPSRWLCRMEDEHRDVKAGLAAATSPK
jgi:hypothetical protein